MFQRVWTKWGVLLASGAILATGFGGCIANWVRDIAVLNIVD